jgi:hypothetical protein
MILSHLQSMLQNQDRALAIGLRKGVAVTSILDRRARLASEESAERGRDHRERADSIHLVTQGAPMYLSRAEKERAISNQIIPSRNVIQVFISLTRVLWCGTGNDEMIEGDVRRR